MAVSTYLTFLMYKASAASSYSKLVDITAFPDMGGAPNMLETTTLTDDMQTFIPGIKQVDDGLEFNANYTKADFQTVKALEGTEQDFAVWKGGTTSGSTVTPTGEDGKWSFKGMVSVYVNGGGVDEVVGMTISIAPTTVIQFE